MALLRKVSAMTLPRHLRKMLNALGMKESGLIGAMI